MVKVDKEKCIGCGTCVALCEEIFEIDEETFKARVKKDAKRDAECLKKAIASCPTNAISK